MIITLRGLPGSGKSFAGKLLAKKLNYEFHDIGLWRRQEAANRGITLKEFNEWATKHPQVGDIIFDNKQKELAQSADNLVIDGHMSFHFIPNSIKIYFDVDKDIAIKRIQKRNAEQSRVGQDDKITTDIAELTTQYENRIKNDTNRYMSAYGINHLDPKGSDLVIDTTHMTPEQVVQKILDFIDTFK